MKRLIFTLLLVVSTAFSALAQSYNDKADNIVGKFELLQDGERVQVAVTKNSAGTYDCQIVWLEVPNEKNGSKKLDVKNPDKSLRSLPLEKAVLFKGLAYDKAKKQWTGAKIYDPTRGIKANVTCTLTDKNNLFLRATILGIGEKQEWKRIN